MVTSVREFNLELYVEHLEEASFLYAQRLVYLHDKELAWLDLEELEERFEAHIDALVVGGDLALEVCEQRLKLGDFGEVHAALRVFCRLHRQASVYAVLQNIDTASVELTRAASDALSADCPKSWHDDLARIVARHPRLASVLAPVLAYRRAKSEVALLTSLESADSPGVAAVLRAVGRVGEAASVAAAESFVRSGDAAVSEAACRAAIRLGNYQTVRYCLLAAQTRPWMSMTLALGGDRSAVSVLMERAGSEHVDDDLLLGLGVLGDLTAVRSIFNCLELPERASAAALALQLITGAELYEEVFVPDEVDSDELFDEERERYEVTGELPKRADGQPFGSTTVQIVTDQAVWKEWLSQNKARFDPSARYRYGEFYSPRSLLKSLLAERVPNRIRSIVCDEFRVRYGIDFPMEVDMPVIEQNRLLARLGEWVQGNDAKFEPGEWYFHGRAMT